MNKLKNEKEHYRSIINTDKQVIQDLTEENSGFKKEAETLKQEISQLRDEIEKIEEERIRKEVTLDEQTYSDMGYVLAKNFESLKLESFMILEVNPTILINFRNFLRKLTVM